MKKQDKIAIVIMFLIGTLAGLYLLFVDTEPVVKINTNIHVNVSSNENVNKDVYCESNKVKVK